MFRFNKPTLTKDTVSIAGWLFADLLLGLSMFFLVTNSIGYKTEPTMTPTITNTPTPTKTVTPAITATLTPTRTPKITSTTTLSFQSTLTETAPPRSQGLEMEPVSCRFVVEVQALLAGNTVSESMKEYVGRQLDRCYGGDRDRIAGFVLTLGYHQDIVGVGYVLAQRINSTMVELMPEMFGSVQSEAFGAHREDTEHGTIWIRVYFVTGIDIPDG